MTIKIDGGRGSTHKHDCCHTPLPPNPFPPNLPQIVLQTCLLECPHLPPHFQVPPSPPSRQLSHPPHFHVRNLEGGAEEAGEGEGRGGGHRCQVMDFERVRCEWVIWVLLSPRLVADTDGCCVCVYIVYECVYMYVWKMYISRICIHIWALLSPRLVSDTDGCCICVCIVYEYMYVYACRIYMYT